MNGKFKRNYLFESKIFCINIMNVANASVFFWVCVCVCARARVF